MGRKKSQRTKKTVQSGPMPETPNPTIAPTVPIAGPRRRRNTDDRLSSFSLRPRQRIFLVALLLGIHFLLAVSSAWNKSPTYDEPLHFTVAATIWETGDFRLAAGSTPLAGLWATLPLVQGPLKFPRFDNPAWYESNHFILAPQFFYGMGNSVERMLRRGRAMISWISVTSGLVVFLISRRLFGDLGGLLSLYLYTFSPNILAHAQLVTADVTATAFFLFSITTAWWAFHRISWKSVLVSGLAMAGLILSKMAALFLAPVLIGMLLVRTLAREPVTILRAGAEQIRDTRWPKLKALLAVAAGQLVVVYVCIWALYGFQYSAFKAFRHPGEHLLIAHAQFNGMDPWEVQYRELPRLKSVIEFGRRTHLLPEIYLYSIAFGAQSARMRFAFLNGEHSLSGFSGFFPYCFLYKTPLPLMALLLCALIASVLKWRTRAVTEAPDGTTFIGEMRQSLYDTAPLWLLLISYWIIVIPSHLNIGDRHILPTYPPLFILAGAATGLLRHRIMPVRWLVPGLAACMVVSSVRIYPNYLAYFNCIAGGPAQGHRHLVDSSLDWGQDLIGLKKWLDQNAKDKNVFIAYFGNAPPAFYGIKAHQLPYESIGFVKPPRIGLPRLEAGIYCISATRLQQVYPPDLSEWTPAKDANYWKLLPLMKEFEKLPLDDEDELKKQVQSKGPEFAESFDLFQRLRFGKLCDALRKREPDTHIGHSILIYDLDEQALNNALNNSGST